MARCRYSLGNFPFVVSRLTGGAPAGSFLAAGLQPVVDWYWRVCAWDVTIGCAGISIYDSANSTTFAVSACSATLRVFISPDPAYLVGRTLTATPDEHWLTVPSRFIVPLSSVGRAGLIGTSTWIYAPPPPLTGSSLVEYDVYGQVAFVMFAANSSLLHYDLQPSSTPANTPVSPVLFDPASGLYRPTADLRAIMGMQSGGGGRFELGTGPVPEYVYDEGWDPSCYRSTTITVNMGGSTLLIPGYVLAVAISSSSSANVVDDHPLRPTITVAPAVWWTYSGNDNRPLYNSMDGTPAINPTTGVPYTPAEIAAAPWP